jgi:hypothetical protein
MPAVLLPRPAPRPTRTLLRLATRERRRLTLPRAPRLLQLPLKLLNLQAQPLILAREPDRLAPQLLVLRRQRRAPRHPTRQLINSPDREQLTTRFGDGNHHHQRSRQAT